jgi:hypothetical protein
MRTSCVAEVQDACHDIERQRGDSETRGSDRRAGLTLRIAPRRRQSSRTDAELSPCFGWP